MKMVAAKTSREPFGPRSARLRAATRVFISFFFLGFLSTELFSNDQQGEDLAKISLEFIESYDTAADVRDGREVQRLERVIRQPGGSELKVIAGLKLARLSKAKNQKLALQYLKIAEANLEKGQTRLAALVYTDLAILYSEAGSDNKALSALSSIEPPESVKLRTLFYQTQSLCYSRLNMHAKAAAAYQQILRSINAKNLPDAYLLPLSNTFRSLGKVALEIRFLEVLASRYPFSEPSHTALLRLKSYARRDKNAYHFSASLLRKLKLHSAVHSELEKSLPEFLDYPVEIDGEKVQSVDAFQRADLAMDLNLDNIAAKIISDISSQENRLSHARKGELLRLRARWFIRDGNHEQALAAYKKHKSHFPGMSQSHRLQSRIANLYGDMGEFDKAAKYMAGHARRTKRRSDRWRHFWYVYRAGDYTQALKLLERRGYVQGHDSYRTKDEVLYWHGKVLERLRDFAGASTKYSRLMIDHPNSFYTAILKSKIAGYYREQDTSASNLRVGEALRTRLIGYLKGAKSMLLASNDLSPLERNEPEQVDHKRLINFLKKPEMLALSVRSESYSEEKLFENYPKAFNQIVEPHAKRIGLDPYLTYSIMKAESDFDKDAISWVGAVGLMQIMPYTGFRIAKEMGDRGYQFDRLHYPHVNISYAQYYIQRLLKHFDGSLVLALASYNGGPEAVIRWLERCRDCEVDEFVESIGYRETRRYVKKVIKNYAVYKSFYEEELPFNDWPNLHKRRFSADGIF